MTKCSWFVLGKGKPFTGLGSYYRLDLNTLVIDLPLDKETHCL